MVCTSYGISQGFFSYVLFEKFYILHLGYELF